jgi:anti-anti-sigma regulatory factor
MNSPVMKAFGDERIGAGETLLVVDLGACTGMDSTFMGTLAGMASRLGSIDGGQLHVADPGERNRRSLEDLGLDFLMEIDPPAASWRGQMDAVRSSLGPPRPTSGIGRVERARHVLEAHQTLSDVNESNAREFSNLLSLMQNELSGKEKLAETDKKD